MRAISTGELLWQTAEHCANTEGKEQDQHHERKAGPGQSAATARHIVPGIAHREANITSNRVPHWGPVTQLPKNSASTGARAFGSTSWV
jgi:hypothetical protein